MYTVKRIFILMLGLILATYGFAQTSTTPDLNKSLIPPSPDAASLGKYGIVPVTLYEGMPNTSVPVYEIKSNRLSLPISLGYNYNGYRPGEESSWIGLGWSLQAYGVITRVVKGLVDGVTPTVQHEWQEYANILDMSDKQSFLVEVASRHVDSEPDLYIFNFNGHSGKFIMVGSRAFTFPHQDLQITRVGTGFRIVAEDGVTYNFYNTELTTPQNSNSPGNAVPPYISAWNLTSMISADHTDQIDFQYTSWSHRQYNNAYSETYVQQSGGSQNNSGCSGLNSNCDSWSVNTYPGAYINASRLTRILSKNCMVDFIPESSQRLDLNSTTAFALKEIKIYSLPDTALFKKMELAHDYFGYNAQLKLNKVNLTGYYGNNAPANPNISLPGYYNFEYANEATGSFPKSTRGIDKWGYYNGRDDNAMLFDADFLPYTPCCRPPANRTVDATKSINGTLTKITYPTGGYTTFDYEGNVIGLSGSYYTQNLQTSLFVVYNGVNNPTVVSKTFTITDPQQINISYYRDISNAPNNWVHNYIPILKIYIPGNDEPPPNNVPPQLIYTSPIMNPGQSSNTAVFTIQPGNYYYTVSCESTSISSSAVIKYFAVYNSQPTTAGPGVRVREIKSYDSVHYAAPALTKTYTYLPAVSISLEGYGLSTTQHQTANTNYTQNIYSSNYSSPLFSLAGNQFYYPKVTEVNHDAAGAGKTVYEYAGDGISALGVNLLKQTDYGFNAVNNTAILLKQKTNTYIAKPPVNFMCFTHNLMQIAEGAGTPALSNPEMLDPAIRYALFEARPYALTSNCLQLSATDEVANDQYGLNPMTVHTDYYYDNSNYVQPSRTVVLNSKGETITTQVKYPYDCATGGACAFPGWQENAFKIKQLEASTAYQNCVTQRYNYALPFWSPTIPNSQNGPLINALNSYPCETNYPGQFTTALNSIANMPCPTQGGYTDIGVSFMQASHIVSTPVEQIVSISRGGNDYLFAATRTEFTTNGGITVSPKTLDQTKFISTSTLKSDYIANPSNYLQARVNFTSDAFNNIVEQSKLNDVKMAYIWDYKNTLAIAQCTNADKDNIAYTSFEADGKGRFGFSGTIITAAAPTGKKVYQLNTGNITIATDAAKVYTITLWASAGNVTVNGSGPVKTGRTINNFTCYQYQVSNASTVTISGNANIDELRLYPKDGLMTTYTYDPLVGITSQCDPNNHISYYEYDALARLLIVRNEDRNIIKQYQYNYDRWQTENSPNWQPTGLTQCKPCAANNAYMSNILQQQERDLNTNSPSYNQTRWIDLGPSPICDAPADWHFVSPPQYRCVLNANNENTGEQEQKQEDLNPCSATAGTTRWVNIGMNTTICPLPSSCTNCTGPDKKCINSVCETGTKIYTASVYNPKVGYWVCTYHYHWSDGSNSIDYTESSTASCTPVTGG